MIILEQTLLLRRTSPVSQCLAFVPILSLAAEPSPEDVEAESKSRLEEGWDLDENDVAADDPDEYLEADHQHANSAAVEVAEMSGEVEVDEDDSAMNLPEVTTESYEDDPEVSRGLFLTSVIPEDFVRTEMVQHASPRLA